MRPVKFWLSTVTALMLLIQGSATSHANFLNNSIDKTPPLSKNLELFFIDLSGSVDYQVVTKGFDNIRQNLAYIYEGADPEKGKSAVSYYRWIPIRGAEANSSDLPIFTEEDDAALWLAAKKIRGKANQLQVLTRLRESNGLWSRLMLAQDLNFAQCQRASFYYLRSPGLSGGAFQRLNSEICSIALRVRARVKQVIDNIESYTKPIIMTTSNGETIIRTERRTTGTDIFGTVNKFENLARNSTTLKRFEEIKLVFVSDMLHNTDSINLRKTLKNMSPTQSCQLANERAGANSGFDSKKYFPTIYGLGEVREKKNGSTKAMEMRYPVLKEFWDCFWAKKGLNIPDAEFRKLNTFQNKG